MFSLRPSHLISLQQCLQSAGCIASSWRTTRLRKSAPWHPLGTQIRGRRSAELNRLVGLRRCERPRLPPNPVWWTGSASSRRAFQGWPPCLLPNALRPQWLRKPVSQVPSPSPLFLLVLKGTHSGPVKAYQYRQTFIQSAVGSWQDAASGRELCLVDGRSGSARLYFVAD